MDSTIWYRIRVDDPQLASSASFLSLVQRILKHVRASAVRVTNLEGVWRSQPKFLEVEERAFTFTLDALCEELENLTQLVWGRFFFLRQGEDAGEFNDAGDRGQFNGQALEKSIAVSEATLCVADNCSYFVFTTSLPLVCELLADSWPVEVLKGDLSGILDRGEDY